MDTDEKSTDRLDWVDEEREGEQMGRRTNWLIPLLSIPVFFVLGWLANDVATSSMRTQDAQQEYGIGGGPEVQIWTSPTPIASPMPIDESSTDNSSSSVDSIEDINSNN